MKYCKNCGMLLEDSCDICIGCGLDTANPENVSKYPPKMEKKLEAEKKQNKTRRTTIIAIIVVFVLLLGLLCYILFNSSDFFTSLFTPFEEENYEAYEEDEFVDEYPEEIENFPEEEPYDPKSDPNRPVKDEAGNYYSRFTLNDEAGNKVFTGLYPEDFKVNTSDIDYSKYSVRFPGRVTFSVGNEDDTVHFTYLSPEQFWYRKSEKGKTLQNNRDLMFYMSYLTYEGGQGYADMLIKTSYPKARKVTLKETVEVASSVSDKLSETAKAFKSEARSVNLDDTAHIAGDTVYAVMESEYTANIYKYEIVNQDKSTLFLEFYVPVMANKLNYSSKSTNDMGTMTEWITLGVYCFEAGNEDMFDDFEPAFNIFMDNCVLSREFYNICELRGNDINDNIRQEIQTEAPDAATLSGYASRLGGSLTELDELIYKFTSRRADDKIFMLDDYVLNAKPEMSVAFVNAEKEKVFISPAADEYPGAGYLDMNEIGYDDDTVSNAGLMGPAIDGDVIDETMPDAEAEAEADVESEPEEDLSDVDIPDDMVEAEEM